MKLSFEETSRPTRGVLPRLKARTALLVGFGALMAIAVAGAVNLWITLHQLQSQSATILDEYLQRERVLRQARTNAYLSTTFLRDFVLDPDPSRSEAHLEGLRNFRVQLNAAIAEYRPLVEARNRSAFEELAQGVKHFWEEVDPLFGWSAEQRRRNGFQFLAQRILPQRARLIELTDSIGAFNQQELYRHQRLLSELYRQARWHLGLVLALSLLFGAAVAVVSFLYLSRLERAARSSFDEVVQTRSELERLSLRLVEAQEQERRALARELHDEVGQSLSALLVDVANAAASSPPGHPELEARHASIRALAEHTLHVIRNMSLLLRPSMLDDLGLVPALEWQARELSRRTGLEVQVEAEGVPDDLPEDVRTCIYRVVQEALNNCLRHAEARRVDVIVRSDGGRLLVLIRDDGVGFDPRTIRGEGNAKGRGGAGLIGIDERVRVFGGAVRVESSPGRGCLVQAELPLPRDRSNTNHDHHPAR